MQPTKYIATNLSRQKQNKTTEIIKEMHLAGRASSKKNPRKMTMCNSVESEMKHSEFSSNMYNKNKTKQRYTRAISIV